MSSESSPKEVVENITGKKVKRQFEDENIFLQANKKLKRHNI